MRRERFLWPLTHGHQHGLAAARIVRERLARDPRDPRLGAEIRSFFEADLEPHFRVEEELLEGLGEAWGAEDPDHLRFLDDHRCLRAWGLSGRSEDAGDFAERLAEHIRFEEETLFPRIEADLDPGARERWEGRFRAAASACPRLPSRPA
jgi:hypothetical protein